MKKGNTPDQEQVQIHVRWFSVLADKRGARDEKIAVPRGSSVHDLKHSLMANFPALENYNDQIRIAINHEFITEDVTLNEGDEVAFLTPVSGG